MLYEDNSRYFGHGLNCFYLHICSRKLEYAAWGVYFLLSSMIQHRFLTGLQHHINHQYLLLFCHFHVPCSPCPVCILMLSALSLLWMHQSEQFITNHFLSERQWILYQESPTLLLYYCTSLVFIFSLFST